MTSEEEALISEEGAFVRYHTLYSIKMKYLEHASTYNLATEPYREATPKEVLWWIYRVITPSLGYIVPLRLAIKD